MLGTLKFWRIAALSLSGSACTLAPALAADCGFNGCDAEYIVQQAPGYPGVLARYCDGYGGGQWPYSDCTFGRSDRGHPIPAPATATILAPSPTPPPIAPPIVTKY
jgi:hypothetical protein